MNKTELVAAVAEKAEISKKDADKVVKAFIEITTDTLKKKGTIQLVGFGTFSTVERAARNGVNPRTGEKVKIKKSVAPKFKPGKALKEAVNKKKK